MSGQVFDRYIGITAGVLDDQQAFAATIDDPVLRSGAMAYGRGLLLEDMTTNLTRDLLAVLVGPSDVSLTDLDSERTEVQQDLDALVAETAGTPFAEAAATLVGVVEASGLLEEAEAAMDGTADIGPVLTAGDLATDQGGRHSSTASRRPWRPGAEVVCRPAVVRAFAWLPRWWRATWPSSRCGWTTVGTRVGTAAPRPGDRATSAGSVTLHHPRQSAASSGESSQPSWSTFHTPSSLTTVT